MNVQETIAGLRSMGYTVRLEPGNKVKLSWQGQGKPDRDKVLPLVDYLKAHKEEFLDLLSKRETGQDTYPISPETLESVFQETLKDLDRRTVQGLLGEANPSILAQERQAKDHLDKTWKEALAGKATLETFRQAVRAWYETVIRLFSTPDKGGTYGR